MPVNPRQKVPGRKVKVMCKHAGGGCKNEAAKGDTLCKSHRFYADHGKAHAAKKTP